MQPNLLVYSTSSFVPVENSSGNQLEKRLPRYVSSANGMIGDSHLIYFLDKEKPSNRNDIILNSFSKRKFQSGYYDDEQRIPKTAKPLKEANCYQQPLCTDKDGYAISTSGLHDEVFIPDDKIKGGAATCTGFRDENENLIIGYYPDGKCIISKPSHYSSTITSIAMLLHNKGENFDFNDLFVSPKYLEGVYKCEDAVQHQLKKYGFECSQLFFKDEDNDSGKRIEELKGWIGKHGVHR